MEKSNVAPFYKKLKNYRPVPICENFFVKLTFSVMLKFFMENDLITSNQSGYKPGCSFTNQLLFMAHEFVNLVEVQIVVMMFEMFFLTIRKLLTRFNKIHRTWKK